MSLAGTPDKPAGGHTALSALAAVLNGTSPGIVCWTRCEPCTFGYHYDPPQEHRWAGPEDIDHAAATGQPEPTGPCACPCARPEEAQR